MMCHVHRAPASTPPAPPRPPSYDSLTVQPTGMQWCWSIYSFVKQPAHFINARDINTNNIVPPQQQAQLQSTIMPLLATTWISCLAAPAMQHHQYQQQATPIWGLISASAIILHHNPVAAAWGIYSAQAVVVYVQQHPQQQRQGLCIVT